MRFICVRGGLALLRLCINFFDWRTYHLLAFKFRLVALIATLTLDDYVPVSFFQSRKLVT